MGPVRIIALRLLQTDYYPTDPGVKLAVDTVMQDPVYDAGPALLAACKQGFRIAEAYRICCLRDGLNPEGLAEAITMIDRAIATAEPATPAKPKGG